MLPNLEQNPKLPALVSSEVYTLVLDLDETLVHYFENEGLGSYDIRPGMHEFLERMNSLGYEVVIFTAATQDYADWVIDQIDPGRLIHHRLYRQHALPWGPIFVKDLSRLGRDLDRTLIIDNVQENFMLQPHNGIFISTWYEDPHDTALFALTPLLDELLATRAKVPEILEKYRDQIPTWAGFDQYSQLGVEYSEFDLGAEEGLMPTDSAGATPSYPGGPGGSYAAHPTEPPSAAMTPPNPAAAGGPLAPVLQQQQQHTMQPPSHAQLQQQSMQQQSMQQLQQQSMQQLQPSLQQHQSQQQMQQMQQQPQMQPQQQLHQQQQQMQVPGGGVEHRTERDVTREISVGEERRAPMTTTYPLAQQSSYTAAMATAEQPAMSMGGGAPAATSQYASRYQQPGTPPYLAQRPPGGYPQAQMQTSAAQHQEAQSAPKTQVVQRPQPQTQIQAAAGIPQGAPRAHMPAPAFSATGISGPYQAPPPSQGVPAAATMWGRAGLGPYQVAAPQRRR
jgi:Dullard-like phosphatase family protein